MPNPLPTLSIVIPCWNAEAFIADAIGSCLGQSYKNIEVVVVNDGSTDGSKDVIDGFGDRIIALHLPNSGAPKARNIGLSAATGQYVMFLDADDYIEGEMISSLIHEMIAVNADIGFGPWVKVRNGIDLSPVHVPKTQTWRDILISWLLGGYIPTCSVIWSKILLENLGGWDEKLSKNQDGDLAFRGLLEKPALAFTNIGHGVYRQHDSLFRVSGASVMKNHAANSIIFEKLLSRSEVHADPEIKKSLGLYAYGFASFMYINRESLLGNLWRDRATKLDVLNASNTRSGLIIGGLFGLRYKTYLSKWIANLKSTFDLFRRAK